MIRLIFLNFDIHHIYAWNKEDNRKICPDSYLPKWPTIPITTGTTFFPTVTKIPFALFQAGIFILFLSSRNEL